VVLPTLKVDGQVCIVMDFYKQGDLWQAILRQGARPFEEHVLYGWITSGLMGLLAIHNSGVVPPTTSCKGAESSCRCIGTSSRRTCCSRTTCSLW
jgi:hypothetical protein